jgi:hypothetical protein
MADSLFALISAKHLAVSRKLLPFERQPSEHTGSCVQTLVFSLLLQDCLLFTQLLKSILVHSASSIFAELTLVVLQRNYD